MLIYLIWINSTFSTLLNNTNINITNKHSFPKIITLEMNPLT